MALLKQILLAAAMPGIAAGLLLGIGRAIARVFNSPQHPLTEAYLTGKRG